LKLRHPTRSDDPKREQPPIPLQESRSEIITNTP
jgi:hypothetical protein